MDPYTSFAEVYDTLMDNIPYSDWCGYLTSLLRRYGVEDGLVLDMGCGTGTMTQLLCAAGYDMIGLDNSADMLAVAARKAEENRMDILYLLQDMRDFELYGTVRAVISVCDSINYILEEEELLRVFRLVNNYLDPGGVLIFDLNMPYKYEVLGDCTIAENRENCSFIWDNFYDADARINEYDLNLFIRDERVRESSGAGEPFLRFSETHYQRAYALDTIRGLIEAAGMTFVAAYDAFSYDAPRADSERVYVVARERGKEISGG